MTKTFPNDSLAEIMLIATLVLFILLGPTASLMTGMASNRRIKRIAFGQPVPSLSMFQLHHFVQLRLSWACTSDQTKHDDTIKFCQEDRNRCGGTLIHPDFVLTAAHCVMYYEMVIYDKDKPHPRSPKGSAEWVKTIPDSIYYSSINFWEKLKFAITGFFIIPKPRHTVYSDWSMLMGSHDTFKMTQKRHAMKIFPHQSFPKVGILAEGNEDLVEMIDTFHDVALVQSCLPFKIKQGEVELTPMLKTVEELRGQFDRIVRKNMVCLYAGFGRQDNPTREIWKLGRAVWYPSNWMLHTWRASQCPSRCNMWPSNRSLEHSCSLCSTHLGSGLGTPEKGDSGSPVTCEGKVVGAFNRGYLRVSYNMSGAVSYPLHCIKHAITEKMLDYYKSVVAADYTSYHPLNTTRHRRLPLPQI